MDSILTNQDAPRSGARSCSTTASPQLGSCCFGDFLAANSTGTKRRPAEEIGLSLFLQRSFFRWRSSAEAQASTLAKLAPPHTAAHKLGHQLLYSRTDTSLGRRQLCFCGHPDTSTQTPPVEQVCWSDAYSQNSAPPKASRPRECFSGDHAA